MEKLTFDKLITLLKPGYQIRQVNGALEDSDMSIRIVNSVVFEDVSVPITNAPDLKFKTVPTLIVEFDKTPGIDSIIMVHDPNYVHDLEIPLTVFTSNTFELRHAVTEKVLEGYELLERQWPITDDDRFAAFKAVGYHVDDTTIVNFRDTLEHEMSLTIKSHLKVARDKFRHTGGRELAREIDRYLVVLAVRNAS